MSGDWPKCRRCVATSLAQIRMGWSRLLTLISSVARSPSTGLERCASAVAVWDEVGDDLERGLIVPVHYSHVPVRR